MKPVILKLLNLRCLLATTAYVRDWLETLEIEIGKRNLQHLNKRYHDTSY
jgi:hypothetical protein